MSVLLVGGADAVRIVGEHKSPPILLVGSVSHMSANSIADHAEAPEEVVGPLEALLGIAFAPEEPGLPGIVRGDAGNAGELALVGDRIDRVADVDEPIMMSTLSLLMSCAVTSEARFGFDWLSLGDDLDIVFLPGDRDAVGKLLAHARGDPLRRLAEGGDRAGLRASPCRS